MSAIWSWPGSRWWRVDLHAHSPASHDYVPEAERLARDWGQWLAAAESANLDSVVSADHNTPDGIQGIQASNAGRLVVFPGLELSVAGIHLVCIMDPSCSRDDLVSLLSQLGILPPQYGATDTASLKGLCEAMDTVHRLGGVVVAAHANGPKGLLTGLEGLQRRQALEANSLSAVELAPPPKGVEGWLDPESPETLKWLDGSSGGRSISVVCGSDSHQRSEAGRRFTWIKMTRPSIEGLALALLDGDLSLRRSTIADAVDPNRHASKVIESISVRDAQYMGRPTPFVVPLNPWLNAIIGGRGTGKSTLVDMLRLTLDRTSELGSEGDGSLGDVFWGRMRVPPSRQDEGLLTEGTAIEVVYRREGERFAVTWDHVKNESRIARIDGEQRIAEEGRVSERFPVRIYSQKQLFDLAKSPNALLTVIDDTEQVRGDELTRRRREAESLYLSLMAGARTLRTEAAEIGARKAALEDLRRKIGLFEQRGNAAILSEYRLRREQSDLWAGTRQAVLDVLEGVQSWMPEEGSEPAEASQALSESDPATLGLVESVSQSGLIARQFVANVREALSAGRTSLDAVEATSGHLLWRLSMDKAEAEYGKLSLQLTEAGITDEGSYGQLLSRRAEAEAQIKAYEAKLELAGVREREAQEALAQYRAARAELSARRVQFAGRASSDLTRVEIRELADASGCESFVREALGIDRFDDDHKEIVEAIVGSRSRAWSYGPLDDLVGRLRAFCLDATAHWPAAHDHRFESALRRLKPERLDRLALFAPGDTVEVSYSDQRRGRSQWKKLALGSPGQQTAALLAFVLGYGEEPIILDQPEDDLDSTLIYNLLVQRLRASKQSRQIVVVTHNANIVVHGDAELVTSLEAVNGQTIVNCSGGLQEHAVREEVCRVLEGGKDAFDLRYRRILEIAIRGDASSRRAPTGESLTGRVASAGQSGTAST